MSEFVELWREGSEGAIVLAEITLARRDGSGSDVIRAGTRAHATPDGIVWQGMIEDVGPVNAALGFAATGIDLASSSLTLADVPIGWQADGETLLGTCRTHRWLGAAVRLALVVPDATAVDAFDQGLQFSGVVIDPQADGNSLVLSLRQGAEWNASVTPNTATRDVYPLVPDGSEGAVIPPRFGRVADVGLRSPWPSEFPTSRYLPTDATKDLPMIRVRGGRRAGPGLIVDTGRGPTGAAKAKLLVAPHELAAIGDEAQGLGFYLQNGSELARIVPTPGDVFNAPAGAGLLIPDTGLVGYTTAAPANVTDTGLGSLLENGRALLDPANDFNYALADWSAGFKWAQLYWPGVTSLGVFQDAFLVVGYRSVANTNLQVRLLSSQFGSGLTVALPATSTPSLRHFSIVHAGAVGDLTAQGWNLSNLIVQIGWPQFAPVVTGTGSAEFYFVGIAIKFEPRQKLLETERIVVTSRTRPAPERPSGSGSVLGTIHAPYAKAERLPAELEVTGTFYAGSHGAKDDGAGTFDGVEYTFLGLNWSFGSTTISCQLGGQIEQWHQLAPGDLLVTSNGYGSSGVATIVSVDISNTQITMSVASAGNTLLGNGTATFRRVSRMLERAPDLLAYLLNVYGSVPLTSIERGVGAFGSFVDARARLLTYRGLDRTFAAELTAETDVQTAATELLSDAMSAAFVDRTDGRWKFLPWATDLPTSYPYAFGPDDVLDPSGPDFKSLSLTRIVTGAKLAYSWLPHTRAFANEINIGPTGSQSGHRYKNLRFERSDVASGGLDKFDFQLVAGTPITVTLTPGDYTPSERLAELRARMQLAAPAESFLCVGSFEIVAGYNDQPEWLENSTARSATIAPGVYTSASALAAAINAGHITAGSPFRWGYSHTTRRWRNFPNPGGVTAIYKCLSVTGGLRSRRFWATLGIETTGTDAAATAGTYYQRLPGHALIARIGGTLDLLFESGPHGYKNTNRNAHDLFGFDGLRDRLAAGVTTQWMGDSPIGSRELVCRQARDGFGPRRPVSEECKWTSDDDTALAKARTLVDLLAVERIEITFTTRSAPDIERGRVFGFRVETAGWKSYPAGDGSWAGRRFIVTEVVQHLGPSSYATEIVAVEL